jgi:toxin ParE1/3/4
MRVRWTREALGSLDSIAEHIAKDRPMAAERIVERIYDSLAHLARFPKMGRPGRVPVTRELVVSGTPFIIPYRIRRDDIEVITVLHAARQWPDRF